MKVVRRSLRPAADRLGDRDRVEGRVDLDRVERAGVDRQEVGRARAVRVERARPTRRSSIPACRFESVAGHTMESVRQVTERVKV